VLNKNVQIYQQLFFHVHIYKLQKSNNIKGHCRSPGHPMTTRNLKNNLKKVVAIQPNPVF